MKSEERELDEAQNDQDEVGEADSDPESSGPAENLREKALVNRIGCVPSLDCVYAALD
jgi:hypothetical protein